MLWAHLAVLLHVFFKVSRVSELPIAVGTSEPENEVQEKSFVRWLVGWLSSYSSWRMLTFYSSDNNLKIMRTY